MKLTSSKGDELEFLVAGYQFPGSGEKWLNITVKVKNDRGMWSAIDPCLEVPELRWIIKWFENIRDGKPVEEELTFTEPNLCLKLVPESPQHLRIYFELELRPAWAHWKHSDMRDLWVEFELTSDNIEHIITSLKTQLEQLPPK